MKKKKLRVFISFLPFRLLLLSNDARGLVCSSECVRATRKKRVCLGLEERETMREEELALTFFPSSFYEKRRTEKTRSLFGGKLEEASEHR